MKQIIEIIIKNKELEKKILKKSKLETKQNKEIIEDIFKEKVTQLDPLIIYMIPKVRINLVFIANDIIENFERQEYKENKDFKIKLKMVKNDE